MPDTKITTNQLRLHSSQQIHESFDEPANTAYYLFVGNHDPANTEVSNLEDSIYDTVSEVYYNMISGKRITKSDVKCAIRNVPYVSGHVYDMYDDQDPGLASKDYFVITDEGSYRHVYKVLDNNRGANSTIEPTFSHIVGSNTYIYQTSDGYRWKYMYSVPSSTVLKFGTSDYFPIVSNAEVKEAAIPGTIDIIKVEGIGYRYDNYVTGTLSTSNIRIGGNSFLYELANTTVSTTNDFYNGCIMYLTSGTGSGQYSTISDYISNNDGHYVVLEDEFDISPTNGTEYEIYPEVKIKGTGPNIVEARARALVNSLASNTIFRVEVLNRGSGYDYVYSANVFADPTVGVTLPAELRTIISPSTGHGYDAGAELASNSLIFSVKLSNTESNTIPAINSFKQIGVIQDPIFANVSIEVKNQEGTFTVGERLYQIRPYRVATNATVNTTSANVDCNTAVFLNQFSSNDWIYLVGSDGLSAELGTVSSIASNTQLVLTSNGLFACTDTEVYKTETWTWADVISSNGTHVLMANVHGTLTSDDLFIGELSGARAQVNTVIINDVTKGFDTFVQMYKYIGILNSGEFEQNELVLQSNSAIEQNSQALVHSVAEDGANTILFTTRQTGEFRAGGTNTVIGQTSGASLRLDTKYPPELVYGSGRVLFVENVAEITRSNTTSETFQIILSF